MEAVLKDSDANIYQTWDSCDVDDHFQWYQKEGAGKRENHYRGVGNIPSLIEWAEVLPAATIDVHQPWYYSQHLALAFPTFCMNSANQLQHTYKFRRLISSLLRVQVYHEDKWVNIVDKIERFVDIKRDTAINIPELYGRYGYLSQESLENIKCYITKSYYIQNIKNCDPSNPQDAGKIAVHKISSSTPCLAIFWKAENMTATAIRNFSNYTTNIDDISMGTDPIESNSLKYIRTDKFNKMSSNHFNIAISREHFPSAPCEEGYHAYSYAWDSMTCHAEIGMVLADDAHLSCAFFKNENVTYVEDSSTIESKRSADSPLIKDIEVLKSKYILRTRLLVIRKLTIDKTDGTYRFSVT
jgi:hypothetical protein